MDTLAPLRGSQLDMSSDPNHSPGAAGKGNVQRSCRCVDLPLHAVWLACCGITQYENPRRWGQASEAVYIFTQQQAHTHMQTCTH